MARVTQDVQYGSKVLNALCGQDLVVLIASTFREASQMKRDLEACFPRANMMASTWSRPENLAGLHKVLFIAAGDPPPEVMDWIRPSFGLLITL